MTEIHDLAELRRRLDEGAPLHGLRVQGLDLRSLEAPLRARTDLSGMAVLGGRLTGKLARHLTTHGAVVFPAVPEAPVDPYRAVLYHPRELYAGLAQGYRRTPDYRAYTWALDAATARDPLVTALRALHDDAMTDALVEALDGYPVVGVMGGHGLRRDDPGFARAAHLGRLLGRAGKTVLTGGGPGAMEAVNLGAYAAPLAEDALAGAVAELATAPVFAEVDAWAGCAFAVREHLDQAIPPDHGRLRSLGMPTWFYGHEPPNVFCDGIAKYFSNALREDGLLARSVSGVVVLPGAAGTVQEIFQAVTPRYYDTGRSPVAALVLVGSTHWQRQVPVWPLLTALSQGKAFSARLHLVDDLDEVVDVLG